MTDAVPKACQSTKSHLLALPPELRNRIYSHVFASTTITIGSLQLPRNPYRPGQPPRTLVPGVLLACREIYKEAALMYYHLTTFRAAFSATLAKWLNRLPKRYIASIANVRLETEASTFTYDHRERRFKTARYVGVNSIKFAHSEMDHVYAVLASGRLAALRPDAVKASVKTDDGAVKWMSVDEISSALHAVSDQRMREALQL